MISALRSVGQNAFYDDSYDFDKVIMVLRRTTMEDRVVNGIVLERKRMDAEIPLGIKDARVCQDWI